MEGKRITISDIAREAGVTKSTVSFVLNDRDGRVPISAATRERVMEVVRRYHYQPNPMARSLTTKRTGYLGFFLSDNMTGGFANTMFATCLNGAEEECRKLGYALNVGLFNLSCIDNFLFPTPIRQRCVDGVILAGAVADEILDKFAAAQVPCVCIGDYMSHPERVTTVATDITSGSIMALKFLHQKGYRRIAMHYPTMPRDLLEIERVKAAKALTAELDDCQVCYMLTPDHLGDYAAARQLTEDLLAIPEAERPQALIATDQTTLAMVRELGKAGLQCPKDLALLATADTMLCEFCNPPLTAMHYDLPELGKSAVELLVNHIQNQQPLTSAESRNKFSATLIERSSTREILC